MSLSKFHKPRPLCDDAMTDGSVQSGSLTIERMLTSKEAAIYLGISVGALAMRVYRGEIKPRKLGRLNRFSNIELERLLCSPSEISDN